MQAGVVASGLVILWTGWAWIDPAISLLIAALIVVGTWSLLADATRLALDAVPEGIALLEVAAALAGLPGVEEIHDLHVWALGTSDVALTAHLVRADPTTDAALVAGACALMRERFGIGHATIQCETRAMAQACDLRPAMVV